MSSDAHHHFPPHANILDIQKPKTENIHTREDRIIAFCNLLIELVEAMRLHLV